ncbi:MAG: BON domain-containing protein [Blastocatellales bacterium]
MIISLTFATGTMALANGNDKAIKRSATATRSGQTSDQATITKEVRHELTMLPYYSLFDWLEFRVEDNTVILSGQVTRPTLKSDAEHVVNKLKGVEKVINNIEVLPLSPMDDQIRLREARAIFSFNGPLYRYGFQVVPSIHIIVKNGNVTLKGLVNSQADSNLANIRANGVANVFSVKNELQVMKG